jgi:hypothetical protein
MGDLRWLVLHAGLCELPDAGCPDEIGNGSALPAGSILNQLSEALGHLNPDLLRELVALHTGAPDRQPSQLLIMRQAERQAKQNVA